MLGICWTLWLKIVSIHYFVISNSVINAINALSNIHSFMEQNVVTKHEKVKNGNRKKYWHDIPLHPINTANQAICVRTYGPKHPPHQVIPNLASSLWPKKLKTPPWSSRLCGSKSGLHFVLDPPKRSTLTAFIFRSQNKLFKNLSISDWK